MTWSNAYNSQTAPPRARRLPSPQAFTIGVIL